MNKILVGKVVNTHGIKGEIRIRSNFKYKDRVFVVGNYINILDKDYKITSYRYHKVFDMVKLEGFNDINDVLFMKGKDVYFDKDKLELSNEEVIDSELINYKVKYEDKIGTIKEIMDINGNRVIRVELDREYLIPYNDEFVKINNKEKEIEIKIIEGM